MSTAWLDLGTGWLFEHIRDAVAVVDQTSGVIRLWNPAAARPFGYSSEDVIGESIDRVLPELLSSSAWAELRERDAVPWAFELDGRQRSGGRVPVEITLKPIEAPFAQAPEFAMLVVRDMRTEHRLIAAEERLQRALATQGFLDQATIELALSLDYDTTLNTIAHLPLPRLGSTCVVYAFDDDLAVQAVAASHIEPELEADLAQLQLQLGQRRWSAMSSFEGATLLGSFDDPVWTPEERELFARLGLCKALLLPLQAHNRVLGVMLVGDDGTAELPAGDVAAAVDLARRCALALDNARLYRTAQQAVAARDQFLSIAAHELRAPLARLKSHAEVLLMAHRHQDLDEDRLVWSIERINAAVDRLAVLTKDVLDLSRLRGGHFPFRPQAVDLGQVLRTLEPRLSDSVGERLSVSLTDQSLSVLVDEDRLEQILMNLLDNAAKYSPDGGPIRLQLRSVDDGVVISVRDQGIGLPTGSSELIFEAFGRAANAEQWNVPGMGLGLHICRLMVERHGGRIWAESDGEGRGTTVSVWLPFAARSPMRVGEVAQRLSNQLTLAVGYCELLASSPALPPELREQALGAMHGAQGAAATLETLSESTPAAYRMPPSR